MRRKIERAAIRGVPGTYLFGIVVVFDETGVRVYTVAVAHCWTVAVGQQFVRAALQQHETNEARN